MKFDPRAARNVALLLFVPGSVFALFFALNLRINLSASHVGVGIWRAFPAASIDVGDVVAYDKDEFYAAYPHVREDRMKLPSPVLIKRVAAMPGALIELSGDFVIINGAYWAEARILDDSWRKVEYPLMVPEGTVWLMADVRGAYDSRYHGPVPLRLTRKKLKPILVF
ncbi:MAG: S26 family signal peptidase [Synergistaceae bacterium]|nr:S26 family signal peptidase [Synergistaceae bacterium]